MKKKKLIVIITPILILVTFACVLLHFYLTRPNDDFSISDYKHIKIKSSWDRIYCQDFTYLVCAKTKNGYLEIYDRDLKYQTSIKLPDYKEIKLSYNDVIIIKQDGTVWKYNYEVDKDFIKIEGLSDVTEFFLDEFYYLYKDTKGDFYYIYKYNKSESYGKAPTDVSAVFSKPKLINNLHNAKFLYYCGSFVYTQGGNTYVHYYTNNDEDKIKLFDKDNNIVYDKCIEGISYTKAVKSLKPIYLFDDNEIGYVYKNSRDDIEALGPADLNIEIKKVINEDYGSRVYIINNKNELYKVDFHRNQEDETKIDVEKELLFNHKKFNNIYDNGSSYATDDKYLYKLEK